VGALHILLDYLIDQAEDQLGGDLNFIASYHCDPDLDVGQRLAAITAEARARAQQVHPFHLMVIDSLLALYLSDAKVVAQPAVAAVAGNLAATFNLRTRLFALGCRLYRRGVAQVQAPPAPAQQSVLAAVAEVGTPKAGITGAGS
jgi:tetraprenyl-beta-curcumene synthase